MLGNRNSIFLTNQNPTGNIKFGVGGVHGAASEKMILTSTGNLGIGTNTPSAKLDVNGNSILDHLKLGELKNVGNNSVRYFKIGYFTLPNQYMDGQAIVEVLTRNGGNHTVHINIERGSNQIDSIKTFFIKGSTHAETYYLYRTSANVAELWVKSNQGYDSLQIAIRNHSSDFTPDVSSGQANAPANEVSWSAEGYFFNDGNLGIGTDTPSAKLDVNGDIRIDSGNGGVGILNIYGSNQSTGRVYVGQDGSYGGGIEYNGNGSPVTTGAGSDYITLWRRQNNNDQWTARNRYNNNDWEFRNDIYASIFYDTKSNSYFVNPSQTSILRDLEVKNDIYASIFYDTKSNSYFVNPSQTSILKDLEVNSLEAFVMYAPNTTSYFLNLQSSANSLVVAGDIIAFSSSDKRLKKKIKNIDKPLDIISKIGGYRFEWNEKSHKETNKKDIGVIAQEIEEFLPEIVDTRDNGYKAVDYGKLSALLIEGMKEQQKNINKQENRLDDLERRLKLLEE